MHRFLSTATAMVLLPALIAVGALLVVLRVVRVEQDSLRRYTTAAEKSVEAERLNAELQYQGRMVRSYLLSPDPRALVEIERSREQIDLLLRWMLEMSRTPRERELLEASARSEARIRAQSQKLLEQRQRGAPLEQLLPRVDGELQSLRAALDENMALLVRYQQEEMEAAQRWANQVVDSSVRAYLFGIPVAVAALVTQAAIVMREFHRRRDAQEMAERNAAERAASEARFAGIVSIAADAIISVDEEQRITIFNTGAETIFGYSAQEVLGQPLDVLLPERFRTHHRHFIQAFAGGTVSARRMGERRLLFGLRKSGEEFPAEAAISKLEVGGARILTVILRDVSAQKRVEEEQRFLVRAGELLSSSSLDYERTLSSVAHLAVQSLADWCIVYLWEGGTMRRPKVVHRTADKQELAAELQRIPLDVLQPFLAREVIMHQEPLLIPHTTMEHLASMAQNAEHLELLKRLEARSFLGVPLVANERLLGALMFISSESGRTLHRG
ncbi:PAS domain S-box protein [Vitiosangium sp. GDMCC 1.1324]|uniref:PAS domain S-box protein n=1 Tax=Vitiosangium sp. (strain GDMCC 1.1324) TaxID=2138576 RepID=UPI000D368F87|nr:PAS domain S-box protein [Vitiosangium sp. GDMCC 1.1324]PTL80654.1 hypothetical protein DAT35_28945 [Vitiosangium sp. GDMCC 1.1324]